MLGAAFNDLKIEFNCLKENKKKKPWVEIHVLRNIELGHNVDMAGFFFLKFFGEGRAEESSFYFKKC